MGTCAGIVVAGGRSARMGGQKAALYWHGTTLLRRVSQIVARSVDGPVIVVRSRGQELPDPGPGVELAEDARDGRGPLEGLAAGLAAVGDRAQVAYVSAVDVPLLHPAFVRHVVGLLDAHSDAVVPVIRGRPQPLAAAYRTSVLALVRQSLREGRLRTGQLHERCRTRSVGEALLGEDPRLSAVDADLLSVTNLNYRADYERALALPEPEVVVQWSASPNERMVRACTTGRAAAALGLKLGRHLEVLLNGEVIGHDPELPLVAGDHLSFAQQWSSV